MALSSSSLTLSSLSSSSTSTSTSTSTTARSFYSLFDDNSSRENIPNNNELGLLNDSVLNNFRFDSQEHLQTHALAVSTAFDCIFDLGNDKNDDFNLVVDPNGPRTKRRRLNIHNYQIQPQPQPPSQLQHESNSLNVDNFISDNLSNFQHPISELFPNGNFDFSFDNKISPNNSHNNRQDSGNISSPSHVLSPDSINSNNNRFGFQYILRAATSEAVKVTEDALTYLNQGQNYEIKFNRYGDLSQFYGRTFKSIIRLSFYEKRLQSSEKLKFQCWQQTRTNDRILEVDTNLSYGLKDIKQFSDQTNIVEFTWDGTLSTKDLGLFIRVNCISTEFTARKSGGEKGVPFRLQIETFAENERISLAICQIKVFKMKGADRKQKQDRKKFLKRTFEDRQRFQKSADSTILIEANNDDEYHAIDHSYENGDEGDLQPIVSSTKLLSETGSISNDFRFENGIGFLDPNCPEVLQNWLHKNRFRTVSEYFVNFTLNDMFGLSRHDFIDLCGKYEGIRLFNTLRKRPNQIVLKIYIEKSNKLYEPIYLETLQVSEFRRKLLQMITYANDGCEITEMFVLGPNNIKVILTNDMLAHLADDSIFDVSIIDTAIFLKQVY